MSRDEYQQNKKHLGKLKTSSSNAIRLGNIWNLEYENQHSGWNEYSKFWTLLWYDLKISNTSSILIFLGDSSLWGEDVLFTAATGLGIFVATFPELLGDGFNRYAEGTILEMVGFGGGEMAGCVAVWGMLSFEVPMDK